MCLFPGVWNMAQGAEHMQCSIPRTLQHDPNNWREKKPKILLICLYLSKVGVGRKCESHTAGTQGCIQSNQNNPYTYYLIFLALHFF